MIQLVQAGQDRSQLVAKVLADLPEWFGLPDSTQEYIDQASDRICFQAGEGWGFITLQESSPVCLEIHCMGVLKAHQGQGLGRQLKTMLSARAIIICRSRRWPRAIMRLMMPLMPSTRPVATRPLKSSRISGMNGIPVYFDSSISRPINKMR